MPKSFAELVNCLMLSLQPISSSYPPLPLNTALENNTISLPPGPFKFKDKIVTEIFFLFADPLAQATRAVTAGGFNPMDYRAEVLQHYQNMLAGRFILVFLDGSEGGFQLAKSVDQKEILLNLVCKYFHKEPVFTSLGNSEEVAIWGAHPIKHLYNTGTRKIYQIIHPILAEKTFNYLNQQFFDLLLKNKELNIISLGCGEGLDLAIVAKKFEESNIKVRGLGIDLNKDNVDFAKKNYTSYTFEQQDILNLKISVSPKMLTLVICSGFLTRQVLAGSYPGLKVLHLLSNYYVDSAVALGLAGISVPLLNKEVLNQAGWHAVLENFSIENVHENFSKKNAALYLGRLKSLETCYEHVIFLSKKRNRKEFQNILDLSLSSFSFQLLEHASIDPLFANITQLDLSWSYLEAGKIDVLLEKLKKFTQLEMIIISTYEPWQAELVEKIKAQNLYTVIKRTDSTYPDELPTLLPIRARLLGVYTTMPHEVLYKKAVVIQEESIEDRRLISPTT